MFSLFDIEVTYSIIRFCALKKIVEMSFTSVVPFQFVVRLTVHGLFRQSLVRRSDCTSMILTLITPILDLVLINWESTSATLAMCTSSSRKNGIQ